MKIPSLYKYLFCLSLLGPITLFAQNRQIDSLRNRLNAEQADTNKISTLNILCDKLWRTSNFDAAMTYTKQAEILAAELLTSSDTIIAKAGKNGLATTEKIIGVIYRHHGDYAKALEYDMKALEMYQGTNNKNGIAALLGNIGVVYWSMDKLDKALEYDLKALALTEDIHNKGMMAANIGNIGILYRLQNNYSKALEYDLKAMAIEQDIGDKDGVASNLGNIGLLYMYEKNYDKAMEYDLNALSMVRSLGEKNGVAINQNNIGEIYTLLGKYALGRIYLDSALLVAKSIEDKDEIKNIYIRLYAQDSATHNYKEGVDDLRNFIAYRDSIFNENSSKKAIEAELNFQFTQKQEAEKAEQDKKDALAEQARKKEAIIRNAFIGGFILMMALVFFIFRGYREKQKANKIITERKTEIELQKAIVEEKNKDITASIRYASRIQRALLTTDDYVSQYLPEHFILFKPRDIVSGDFYWAFKSESAFYLACCDCTGHGVPGAFMSLLNISMLNESVIERKISSPDLILNGIRTSVIKALNPDGRSETKDGMDCSLVAIDFQKNILKAACANNPIWIIRGTELIELGADNMPVGIQDSEHKPFTLNSFNLQKGDSIYMFTDGYADQFGGEKGKKFKYKQFKELLLSNTTKPLSEQKKLLDEAFTRWKGDLEQIDDVLVIGLKV